MVMGHVLNQQPDLRNVVLCPALMIGGRKDTFFKVHCVIFRMIYRLKCNIIYITKFSEEYKDLT